MFLIRAAFWLSVVVLLLPSDPQTGAQAPRVSAIDGLVAARAAVADMSAFCDRNPGVCVTGNAAFKVFVAKAEYGAYMLYRYLEQAKSLKADDHGTLKREDIAPAWRGPGNNGDA
jgi:hypothetical protein